MMGDCFVSANPFWHNAKKRRDVALDNAFAASIGECSLPEALGKVRGTDTPLTSTKENPTMGRRVVSVYVIDTDPQLKDEDALVHAYPEQVTSLADGALLLTLSPSIADLHAQHNEKRQETVDVEATRKLGHEVMLPEIPIDKLTIEVVTQSRV